MLRSSRIKKIWDILKEQGNASTKYLANILDVSESTVRRDIDFMTDLDLDDGLQRVHGGVILVKHKLGNEYMFELKQKLNVEQKKAIAKKCLEYIEDGDSIVLDSGTTCLHVARELHNRSGVRVLTVDIKIAEELAKYSTIESTVIGGQIRPGYYTIGGIIALSTLDQFNVEKVIMSVDAIDIDRGITNASEFEVGIKKKIIEIGQKVIIIADHTKFNKLALHKVADLRDIDVIITSRELDSEYADKLRETGAEIVLV